MTTELKIGDKKEFSVGTLTLERIINQGILPEDDTKTIFIETICRDEKGLYYICDCGMIPMDKGYASLEELATVHGKSGITEFNELQELAKELYFKDVLAETFRQSFLERLKAGIPVFDLREKGYYCSYCKKFATKSTAFGSENKVIFVNNDAFYKNKQQIWIINSHYDGCRGWE